MREAHGSNIGKAPQSATWERHPSQAHMERPIGQLEKLVCSCSGLLREVPVLGIQLHSSGKPLFNDQLQTSTQQAKMITKCILP